MSELTLPAPPLLRGMLHQAGFVVACVVGAVFVSAVDGRRLVAAAVFAAAAVTMLGASTLYHRVRWSPRARLRMRQLDHAGIYLLIAGTYTPVGLLALHGSLQHVVLAVVWVGAGAAILVQALLGRFAEVVLRRPGRRARLGRDRRDAADRTKLQGRRRSRCSRRAVSPTRWAQWSTRGAGRTRYRPSSATTRCSTR